MRKPVLLLLSLVVLVPLFAFSADQPPSKGKVQPTMTSPAPSISVSSLLDFSRWFETRGKTSASSSGCGNNFCSQAQRTQCAQSCRHHPFVGLECCFDTCTSFCNCGSVPTGC